MKMVKVRLLMAVLGLIIILGLILFLIVFNQNKNIDQVASKKQVTPSVQSQFNSYCSIQASSSNSASDNNQMAKCVSSPEEAILGKAFVSNEKALKDTFSNYFPNLPVITFVDSGKTFCAAMLIDPNTIAIKAQCFDTSQARDSAVENWSTKIVSKK